MKRLLALLLLACPAAPAFAGGPLPEQAQTSV